MAKKPRMLEMCRCGHNYSWHAKDGCFWARPMCLCPKFG